MSMTAEKLAAVRQVLPVQELILTPQVEKLVFESEQWQRKHRHKRLDESGSQVASRQNIPVFHRHCLTHKFSSRRRLTKIERFGYSSAQILVDINDVKAFTGTGV